MKVLIKVGGTLLDDSDRRQAIAREIADIAGEYEVVVVHGGGKQMTQFLEERGIASRFVEGLRVSDEPVIDAATKIIAGSVNKLLVAAILAAGGRAIGISGVDGLLTRAAKLAPELHSVGQPEKTDGRLLDLLVNSGYLPVIACIAGDENGAIYNVNADQMAISCALGWRAAKVIFLTDVEGAKDQRGQVIRHLSSEGMEALIASGVATAGMRAKLNAAVAALNSGLDDLVIASGHEPAICRRILRGEPVGTRLSREFAQQGASL